MKHRVMCPTFKREIYNKDLLKKTYGTPNWTIFLKCVRFLWINIIFLSIYLLWILINDGVKFVHNIHVFCINDSINAKIRANISIIYSVSEIWFTHRMSKHPPQLSHPPRLVGFTSFLQQHPQRIPPTKSSGMKEKTPIKP